MNVWQNAVITQKGLALQAKLMAGSTLRITKAVTGAGYINPIILQQQTEVLDIKQTLEFRPVSYPESGKCASRTFLTNDGLNTGYTAMQVGYYAEDPDLGEILYFIAQAAEGHGTIIPSENEMPGFGAEWTFYFQYGQADDVTVQVNQAGAVTREEMDAAIAEAISNMPNTPTYSYGTEDLEAGVSELETGKLYFVYE